MSGPSILLVAEFDDAHPAHAAQRCRALERLGCRVDAFDLLKKPGLIGRMAGSDLRGRLRKAVETARAELVLVVGGAELDATLVEQVSNATGIPWVNWFPDDLRTIDQVLRHAPPYDRVFAAGTDIAERLGQAPRRTVAVVALGAA